MHRYFLFSLLILVTACSNNHPVVILHTDLGDIHVEIYADKAPVTGNNFLKHCNANTYDSAFFYRVVNEANQPENKVKIDVVQGGLFYDSIVDVIPPIIHETTEKTGIRHLNGTISMARYGPGTASTEIFICVGDQPELDYNGNRNPDLQGFAAFGKVTSGMEVVEAIHQMKNTDQYLDTPVYFRVEVVE